jgi:hypothetical protein
MSTDPREPSVSFRPLGRAHDWYTGLRSPTGVECCSERDCRPVPYRLNPDTKQEEIEANEAWRPVEYDKALPFRSPDGGAYACCGNPSGEKKPAFRCIIFLAWSTSTVSKGSSPSTVRRPLA